MIMKHFKWQHIQFANGSNPYICTAESAFKWMQKKYKLTAIKENFWLAEEREWGLIDYEQI